MGRILQALTNRCRDAAQKDADRRRCRSLIDCLIPHMTTINTGAILVMHDTSVNPCRTPMQSATARLLAAPGSSGQLPAVMSSWQLRRPRSRKYFHDPDRLPGQLKLPGAARSRQELLAAGQDHENIFMIMTICQSCYAQGPITKIFS